MDPQDDATEVRQTDPPYSRTPADLPPGSNSSTYGPADSGSIEDDANGSPGNPNPDAWLIQKARSIFTSSTDYLEANITTQWERNLAHFHNDHAPGSAFGKKNYRRSQVFRPKTRSNIKGQEAALALALFSSSDLLDISPQDRRDEAQVVSAQINKDLLQYRLTRRMPWFLTVMGAWQDSKVYGVCISHQYWSYEVDTDIVPALDIDGKLVMGEGEDGAPTPMGREVNNVRVDALCCDGVPPENLRFDPMCDWRDPATSSPYLVYLVPMYITDVLERMETEDPKTRQPQWRKYSDGEVLAARRDVSSNRTRQAREGDRRVDPADTNVAGNEFTTVWAHLNILRVNGSDIAWWTLGTELVLTDPIPLVKMYPHLRNGERPFVVGFSTIEAHRNYPAGDVEQTAGLQEEINIVTNQRLDNVKLALNKRFYVKRGSQIDLDALMRSTPGGGVFMNDPERDIKTESFTDVTGSSYQEQDRLATEFDGLAGSVSQDAMAQNQNADTTGKDSQVGRSANMVQDYGIRIFTESWMEPVLRQFVRLIQMYETDEVLLSIAADKAQLLQRFGTDEVTDKLLMQELTVQMNLGMGQTNPTQRVERIVYGVSKAAEIPGMADRIKGSKVADAIFGALGYRDASVFFMTDEEFEKVSAENPPQEPLEIQMKKYELDIRKADNEARDARELRKQEADMEIRLTEIADSKGIKLEQLKTNLGIAQSKNQTARDLGAVAARNKLTELTFRGVEKPQAAPKQGK